MIRAVVDGAVSTSSFPTKWIFSTTAAGSSAAVDWPCLNSVSLFPVADGGLALGSTVSRYSQAHIQQPHFYPANSAAPTVNGEMMFQLTSNTSLQVKVRGSDGVTRTGTITLS